MKYRIISGKNVTLLIQKDEIYDIEEAEAAIRHALTVCGYTPWPSMDIDLFEGSEYSLLIASPAQHTATVSASK